MPNATAYLTVRARPSTRALWRELRALDAALRGRRPTADALLAPILRRARRRLTDEATRRGLDVAALLTPPARRPSTQGPPPVPVPQVDCPPW